MARKGSKGVRRRASRLAAVQALYQMEIANKSCAEAMEDFRRRRLVGVVDGEDQITPESVDEDLFSDIVEGVTRSLGQIDPAIDKAIAMQRGVDRVEVIIRLILRAGAYELMDRPDIDAPLSINEYVAVAQAFFGGPEPGFVNGVLDRLARDLKNPETAIDGKG